jgi:hypothetical protein
MEFKFRVRSRFEFKLPRQIGVELCTVRLGVWQYEEEE